jgi:hypothetical protein
MRRYISPAAIDRMAPDELKSVVADLDGAIGEREAELAELRDLREQAEGRRWSLDPDHPERVRQNRKAAETEAGGPIPWGDGLDADLKPIDGEASDAAA